MCRGGYQQFSPGAVASNTCSNKGLAVGFYNPRGGRVKIPTGHVGSTPVHDVILHGWLAKTHRC